MSPLDARKTLNCVHGSNLLPDEVKSMVAHAGTLGRHRTRDRTIILTMYRHGLRVSELIELKWEQVDFKQAEMHVRRLKSGTPAVHPIKGDELRLPVSWCSGTQRQVPQARGAQAQ